VTEWIAGTPSANTFAGTHRELLRIEQPYRDHNLGQVAFNPNAASNADDYGLLYIAAADGGSDGFPVNNTDPLDNGQDLGVVLGKILRIDPTGSNAGNGAYGIPADNPFVGQANALPELWAYGLRNPHRMSWDTGGSGKMFIADIGQAAIEELNLGVPGANYGWGEREGIWRVDDTTETAVFSLPPEDPTLGYTYPVVQYDHDIPPGVTGFYGIAIAGAYVYRGTEVPALVGQLVLADFGHDGRFFVTPEASVTQGQRATIRELRFCVGASQQTFPKILGSTTPGDVRTDARLGVDSSGEIYVTSKTDGWVRKIVLHSPQLIIPCARTVTPPPRRIAANRSARLG
jgi:glucose/arabinose dehydrogenase